MPVYDDQKEKSGEDTQRNYDREFDGIAAHHGDETEHPLGEREREAGSRRESDEADSPRDSHNPSGSSSGLFNPDGDQSGVKSGPKSKMRDFWQRIVKNVATKKAAIGLGLAGLLGAGGILGLSILAGPAQLVHLGQVLGKSGDSSQTTVHERLGRLFRYAKSGNIGETRVGYWGSRSFGKNVERLKAVGIEFSTNSLDIIKTATFDTNKLNKQFPELKGMSPEEANRFLTEKFSLPEGSLKQISGIGSGKFAVSPDVLGLRATRALLARSQAALDDGKIISAIRWRIMAKFFDAPSLWHPVKAAEAKTAKRAANAADLVKTNKEREAKLKQGVTEKAKPVEESFKGRFSGVNIGISSALLIATAMCLLRDGADDVVAVNRASIVMPAALDATDKIALAAQVETGQDVTDEQLGAVVNSFTDADGQTIWRAEALQAMAGVANSGIDIDPDFAQAFSNDTTAKSIKDTLGGGVVGGVVCSPAGKIVQGLVGAALIIGGFFTGGGTWYAKAAQVGAGMAATAAAVHVISGLFVNLLEDKAVMPDLLSGPVGGNLLAYGAREAAGIAARTSGGVPISKSDSQVLQTRANELNKQQFESQSFFARMFDINDYRSLTGRLAQSISPSFSQNIFAVARNIMNIGSMISGVSSLVPRAHAETVDYPWPFPEYGIPSSVENNESLEDPYKNAEAVAKLLDSGNTSYVDKAKTCFGVNIEKDADGYWSVVPIDEVSPNSDDYVSADCGDTGDKNWARMMLFVSDTRTMQAVACYEGDDEACGQVGMYTAGADANTITTTTGNCSGQTGNAKLPCEAEQFFGYPYAHFDLARGGHCYGSTGSGAVGASGGPAIGYPGSAWVKIVKESPDGKTYKGKDICIGCSGFVNAIFYVAFDQDFSYCSAEYYRNDKNFKTIPLDNIQVGDLVIESSECGQGGHIAIVKSYDKASGKVITVESAAGNNVDGKELSGVYSRSITEFKSVFHYASRYIGPGSGL